MTRYLDVILTALATVAAAFVVCGPAFLLWLGLS